jgi:hypothetical protein
MEAAMDAMDRFVTRENIDRYRRLASESTDAAERSRIMKLLAEEDAKFKLELSREGGAAEGSSPVSTATVNRVGFDGEGRRSGS